LVRTKRKKERKERKKERNKDEYKLFFLKKTMNKIGNNEK